MRNTLNIYSRLLGKCVLKSGARVQGEFHVQKKYSVSLKINSSSQAKKLKHEKQTKNARLVFE